MLKQILPGFLIFFVVLGVVTAEFEDLWIPGFFVDPAIEFIPTGVSTAIFLTAHNNGTAKTDVNYSVDWGQFTVTYTISNFGANETIGIYVSSPVITEPSIWNVCVTLDPFDEFPEDNETNNQACDIISVYSNFLTTLYDQETYVGMWGDEESTADYIGDEQLTFFGLSPFITPLVIPFGADGIPDAQITPRRTPIIPLMI